MFSSSSMIAQPVTPMKNDGREKENQQEHRENQSDRFDFKINLSTKFLLFTLIHILYLNKVFLSRTNYDVHKLQV